MKSTFGWVLVLLLALFSGPARAASPPLDLVPEPARFRNSKADLYRAVVGGVLAPKAPEGSCFQMVSLTHDAPESVLFYDCVGEAEGQPGRLVYLSAVKSIKTVLTKHGVQAALQVKVKRTQVSVDVASGTYLRELWLAMILRAQPSQKMVMDAQRHYFFSACQFVLGCPGAWAQNPAQGSLATMLVAVGTQLALAADAKGKCEGCLGGAMTDARKLRALIDAIPKK
jgi:hypothetical protein